MKASVRMTEMFNSKVKDSEPTKIGYGSLIIGSRRYSSLRNLMGKY